MAEIEEQYGPFEELLIDERLRSHLFERGFFPKHRVRVREILEVFTGEPRFFDNGGPTPQRRAPVIMLGPTLAGRIIAIPIEPTSTHGLWRVLTAYEANVHDRQRYEEGNQ